MQITADNRNTNRKITLSIILKKAYLIKEIKYRIPIKINTNSIIKPLNQIRPNNDINRAKIIIGNVFLNFSVINKSKILVS